MRFWSGDAVASEQVGWVVGSARRAGRRLAAPRPPKAHHVQGLACLIVLVFAVASVAALYQGMVVVPNREAELASAPAAPQPVPEPSQVVRKAAPTVKPAAEPEPAAEVPEPEPKPRVLAAAEERPARPSRPALKLLPTGKGMWFHYLSYTADGPRQIVKRAKAAGLSHLYVRTGSSKSGFQAPAELDELLPLAHEAGLQVVGWDFPYLHNPVADARRAAAAIRYRTPGGHSIDAFTADIETGSEGVKLAADRVDQYGRALRQMVGRKFPLIGTVPNACLNRTYPYAQVARWFDAFAPMVYWITRDPAYDVACNLEKLGYFQLPVLPIGQAYDPAIDNPTLVGWVPRYSHLDAFMDEAARKGAAGVSFWVWHTATPEMWQAIADSGHFTLVPVKAGAVGRPVKVLQRVLVAYGYDVPVHGRYGKATVKAVRDVQERMGVRVTGNLTPETIKALTQPR